MTGNCVPKFKDWVFDTTSSNIGLDLGTCTLIEIALKRELIWIACRHHVFEVMLSDVFSATVEPTSGPDINIFKRFQKKWLIINKSSFEVAADDVFAGMSNGLRQAMIIFYKTEQSQTELRVKITESSFSYVLFFSEEKLKVSYLSGHLVLFTMPDGLLKPSNQ